MHKIVKRLIFIAVTGMILMSTALAAEASNEATDFTLYASGNMTIEGGGGGIIVQNGNAVVNGTVSGLSWTKRVEQGFLYAQDVPEYDDGTDIYRQNVDQKGYLAKGPYAGSYGGTEPNYPIQFKPFPALEQRADLITGDKGATIHQSGWYHRLEVRNTGDVGLIITAPAGEVIEIRADELIVNCNITINGSGKVIFYVDKFVSGSRTTAINPNGESGNVMLYLSGKQDALFYNLNGNFNVYSAGNATMFMNNSGNITGNVYSNGDIRIENSYQVRGFVYALHADVNLSGNAKIYGKLVANHVSFAGSAQVLAGETTALTDGIVQNIVQRNSYPVVTSASEGGTVTAYDRDIEEGTVISVQAIPAEGYRFVRFEGDQPDQDGNITVTRAIKIKAIFEKIIVPTHYVNGLLGEYFDAFQTTNDTAIRMKRIDSQIAFNFGYDAPEGTEGQIEAETFSERWTGYIKVPVTGDYTFKTYSDDGVKLIIDGKELIDRWGLVNLEYTISERIHLEEGKLYPISFEHQQIPFYSTVFLFWEAEGVPMAMIPPEALFVAQETYDAFERPVFMNELSRSGTGLLQQFYDGAEGLQNGDADCQVIGAVNYEWQDGSPDREVLGDAFSARMTGYIEGKFTELMTLEFMVDDGLRVWIDDELLIDSWEPHSDAIIECNFNMMVGNKHKIVIEYNDVGIGATCIMKWKSASQELQVIPIQYLYTE